MEITLKTIQNSEITTYTEQQLGEANKLISEQKKKLEELEAKVKEEMKNRYNNSGVKEFGNAKIVIQNRNSFDSKKFENEATEDEKKIQTELAESEEKFEEIKKKYQLITQIITIRN